MIPTYSTYVATKGAVEQLTRVFAKEVGGRGITVNAVLPGPTNTELLKCTLLLYFRQHFIYTLCQFRQFDSRHGWK